MCLYTYISFSIYMYTYILCDPPPLLSELHKARAKDDRA